MDLTLPDGTVITGVPEDQVDAVFQQWEAAQAQPQPQARPPAPNASSNAFEDLPWYQQAAIGAGKSFVEAGEGLQDLASRATGGFVPAPEVSQSEQDIRESIKGPAATGGSIAAELAMLTLPAGAATKGVRLISALPKARAALAGDILGSAGYGAATAKGDLSDRVKAGEEEAIGAVLGGAAGHALGKTFKGINIKPEAQELIDKGVRLTPGQAGTNPIWEFAEKVTSNIPFVGKRMDNLQMKALEDWNRSVLQEANPIPASPITSGGSKGFKTLKDNFNVAYNSLWNDVAAKGGVDPEQFRMAANLLSDADKVPPSSQKDFDALIDYIDHRLEVAKGSPEAGHIYQEVDQLLRKSSQAARKKNDVLAADALAQLRRAYQDILPADTVERSANLNNQYAKYKTAQRAATASRNVLKGGSHFTPDQLLQAAKVEAEPEWLIRGTAAMQEPALRGVKTIDNMTPGRRGPLREQIGVPGALAAGTAMNPAAVAGVIGGGLGYSSDLARQALLGQTNLQQLLADALRRYANAAPKMQAIKPTAARIGAATGSSLLPQEFLK